MVRFVATLLGTVLAVFWFQPASARELSSSSQTPTFTVDVGPLLATRCSGCHHPGGPGPFSVLSYDEVAPRAHDIVAAVEGRAMPPWKPEPGYGGPFVGERRINDDDLAMLRRWAEAGAPLGVDMPLVASHGAHEHHQGWELGTPDLVVSSEPFMLPGGGKDVFRNFAIALPMEVARYVRGIEFQPGNHTVTHHANIRVDRTSGSQQLDALDPAPGYEGIGSAGAAFPEGYFLGWTPGQVARLQPSGLSWRIAANSTLVVELHLMPSAQTEQVDFRVGLYFSDMPPTRTPVMLRLGRQDIDIPAGAERHVIRDEFRLPVDVDVQSVQPHAHNLAREVKGWATMPDGSRRWLIYIKDWDFHNQDIYRFEEPVRLPRGATVHMEYSYDNSATNPGNPVSPPVRVRWGQHTSDEMGDLWLQMLPVQPAEYRTLLDRSRDKEVADNIVGFRMMLARSPENGLIRANLAEALMATGKWQESIRQFRDHVRLEPDSATAHYNLATGLAALGRSDEAVSEFGRALAIDPRYTFAHSGLGSVLLTSGDLQGALASFRRATAIDPRFAAAHNNSGVALQRLGRDADALAAYLRAAELAPDDADARYNAARLLEIHRKYAGALRLYREAMDILPGDFTIRRRLAWVLATTPDLSSAERTAALRMAEAGVAEQPENPDALDVLAAARAATGDFDGAVSAARSAVSLLADVNERERRVPVEQRLASYRARQPYVAPSEN